MPRVFLALLILVAAPACQQAHASRAGSSARDREVAARLDALDRKIGRLRTIEEHLGRQTEKVSGRMSSLAEKLGNLAASLGDIRGRVKTVGSATSDAASAASAAAAQASDLARRLDVLEKRFEYHLTHDGGR
jgi:chromosome segregation ATPase